METTRYGGTNVPMNSLAVGGELPRKKYPVVEAGVYEAEFKEFTVAMEDSQWGIKQAAKLKFNIIKGPHAGTPLTYKGNFYLNDETKQWIIPSKSKLAAAVNAVTGGIGVLGPQFVGTRVFINVTVNISKKTGEPYSLVDKIMVMPKEYAMASQQQMPQAVPMQQPAPAYQAQQPAQVNTPQVAIPQPQTRVAAPQPQMQTPPPVKKDELLADLTEFADYDLS